MSDRRPGSTRCAIALGLVLVASLAVPGGAFAEARAASFAPATDGPASSGALGPQQAAPQAPLPDPDQVPAATRIGSGGNPADGGVPEAGSPSIQYEDAMAHAADRIAFTPGLPATVPLRSSLALWPDTVAAAAAADGMSPAARVSSKGLRREVFGFLPYWSLGDATLRLDYSVLSTIAYFGVGAGADGHLAKGTSADPDVGWAGWTSGDLAAVINHAHQKGTRVVLTVERFGWTTSQSAATKALLSSPSARATLVGEVVATVEERGADGVNLDFEPIPSGQKDNFTALVRELRAGLDAAIPHAQLTFDAVAELGNYDVTALTAAGAADAMFIMGYDYRTASSGTAGAVAPLAGPRYDLQDTVARALTLTSPSRVILGLPYYGRAWSTVSSSLNSKTRPQGSTYGYSASVPYSDAIELAAKYGRRYDALEQTAWFAYERSNCSGCPTTWRQVYYDDAQSLKAKYDLVNRSNLRGAGIWALGYDGTSRELYAAIAAKFLTDSTPPAAGILPLPSTVNEATFRVAWRGYDDWSGVASYDVQVSDNGGPWKDWLTKTTATSASYPGKGGHGYAFRVRARDGKGNQGGWDVTSTWQADPALGPDGFASVEADTLNVRASPDLDAPVVDTLSAGELVAITGGPVQAGGYTWFEVTEPVTTWNPVDIVQMGVWVAAGNASMTLLSAVQAPNATEVLVAIGGLSFTPVSAPGGTPGLPGLPAPPTGQAPAFSPNGDGRLDALRIGYRLRWRFDALQLNVFRATDRALLGSVPLPGTAAGDGSYDWDGRINGAPVADGGVILQLTGHAAAGTFFAPGQDVTDPAVASVSAVSIDTVAPVPSAMSLSSAAFSPNGDRAQDTERLRVAAPGAVAWTIDALDAQAVVRRTWAVTGESADLTWDGTDAGGAALPDGTYALRATAVDWAGNSASVERPVVVDRVAPSGTLVAAVAGIPGNPPNTFSPNGDGVADITPITWTLSEPVTGTLTIARGATTVWTAKVTAATGTVSWNGRDARGAGVADGTYRAVLAVSDPAANRRSLTATIVVNRVAGSLGVSPNRFYPQDGDKLAARTTIAFRLAGPASTTLRVLDGTGKVVRTAWSGHATPAGRTSWLFDGRAGNGAWLPQGDYLVQLVASNAVGKVALTRLVTVAAFMVRTAITASDQGVTLTATLWSSEALRGLPSATLAVAGGTGSLVGQVTSLENGSYLVTFAGLPAVGTAMLTITATDTGGRVNRQSVAITLGPGAVPAAAGTEVRAPATIGGL